MACANRRVVEKYGTALGWTSEVEEDSKMLHQWLVRLEPQPEGAASQKHQCYGLRDIVYGRLEDLLSPDSTPSATIYHPPLFAQRCKIRETRGILIGQ